MTERMTDERLADYKATRLGLSSGARELLDALIAERAEVERLKVDDHARRIAELDEACCECGRHDLATERKVSEFYKSLLASDRELHVDSGTATIEGRAVCGGQSIIVPGITLELPAREAVKDDEG